MTGCRSSNFIHDCRWPEVFYINRYALFVGYMSMAVRGLAFLVLTWTTVVLLGGFVSMLQKKDLWCLTFITLVQTCGIFDVSMNEKLKNIGKSVGGFAVGWWGRTRKRQEIGMPCFMLGIVVKWVTVLVVFLVWNSLCVVYLFGLLISTGISLWRLIEHDYGANADGGTNLSPALYVLYSIAVIQGVFFICLLASDFGGNKLVSKVAEFYGKEKARSLISDYLRETKRGCKKDPSSANGKNLITSAVDLMASNSLDDYLSGTRILDVLIQLQETALPTTRCKDNCRNKILIGQKTLMKHLISSTPSSHILQKLLGALDSISPYDREMRERAARIVGYFAGDIHLDQFPRGIQCVSSLLGTLEEYRVLQPYQRGWLIDIYQQDWYKKSNLQAYRNMKKYREDSKGHKRLVLEGMRILLKLTAAENNCRIMLDTQGLLAKIMGPVSSDLLHHSGCHAQQPNRAEDDDVAWYDVVEGSLQVMRELVSAPGETGAKLRGEILSNNREAITAVQKIIPCDGCNDELKKQAIGILTQLYMDTQRIEEPVLKMENRVDFINNLMHMFAPYTKNRSIRKSAGEALAMLSFQGGRNANATIILQVNGEKGKLTQILLDDTNKACRIRAAQILEHLCSHGIKDDECMKKHREAMINAMPKVLKEINPHFVFTGIRRPQPQAEKKNQYNEAPYKEWCIMCWCPSIPQDHRLGVNYNVLDERDEEDVNYNVLDERDEEDEYKGLENALWSLCVTICDTFIGFDQDLFDGEITSPQELLQTAIAHSDSTVSSLRVLKIITRMVISMMKHRDRGRYSKNVLEELIQSLSNCSTIYSDLDCSRVFASGTYGATARMPVRTLASLVKEAQEIIGTYGPQESCQLDEVRTYCIP